MLVKVVTLGTVALVGPTISYSTAHEELPDRRDSLDSNASMHEQNYLYTWPWNY